MPRQRPAAPPAFATSATFRSYCSCISPGTPPHTVTSSCRYCRRCCRRYCRCCAALGRRSKDVPTQLSPTYTSGLLPPPPSSTEPLGALGCATGVRAPTVPGVASPPFGVPSAPLAPPTTQLPQLATKLAGLSQLVAQSMVEQSMGARAAATAAAAVAEAAVRAAELPVAWPSEEMAPRGTSRSEPCSFASCTNAAAVSIRCCSLRRIMAGDGARPAGHSKRVLGSSRCCARCNACGTAVSRWCQ